MPSSASASSLDPLVANLCSRIDLDQDDKAAVLALPLTSHALERGEVFVHERDTVDCTCLISDGYAVRLKDVSSGGRQILSIHFKGELVDLHNSLLRVADHSVEMLTAGRVLKIGREHVLRLCRERPRVAHALWLDTLVDASILREWITNIGRRSACTRIAHFLCDSRCGRSSPVSASTISTN